MPLVYPDKLIRVRLDRTLAEPAFVEAMFTSASIRQKLEPFIKSAAGQHGISGGDLKSVKLPMPALSVQREIVRRIEIAFVWLDRVAAEHSNASRLLPRLDQAILSKAFRGELVPQDANDKPVELSATPAEESNGRRTRSTRQRAGAAH
jgi:type I restriction enzyme S subunit